MSETLSWQGAPFGMYLFAGYFQLVGAPVRRGILRKRLVVPGYVSRFAAESTVMTTMGVGASNPEFALRVAARSLKDKSREGVLGRMRAELGETESEIARNPRMRPWESVAQSVFGYYYLRDCDADEFGTDQANALVDSCALFGIGWGLFHRNDFETEFASASAQANSVNNVEPGLQWEWRDISDFYKSCDQLVASWIAECGPLPGLQTSSQ